VTQESPSFLKKRSKKLLVLAPASPASPRQRHKSFLLLFFRKEALFPLLFLLGGCTALTRLTEIGGPPRMTATTDPTSDPKWRPVTMPMPRAEAAPREPASLWRTGSRAFFKDQRAAQVGDIVTVLVNTADTADVENATNATRSSAETMGMPNMLGLEGLLPRILGKAISPASLVSASSGNNNTGTGVIKRNETVVLRLAGVITQVLPNGNLVVAARQELRVNSELRELKVSGVIRPQDIASDNTVPHDRMAEARISYGGRGQLTDVQTPRYGQQALDILLPF
jgi:flagellar L-ring protein precursor FlgH